MGIAQSFEKRLEQFVEGFFARTFRSGLQPVELGRRLAREMASGKTVTSSGVIVANHFRVVLSPQDRERFSHFEDSLRAELVTGLTNECQREGWKLLGPMQIDLVTDPAYKIGRFAIESRIIESAKGQPRLEVAGGEVVPVGEIPVMIGRLPDCQIKLDGANISRRHAEIRKSQQNGGFVVVDLGSTNGTLINGKRISGEAQLRDNDQITVGDTKMVFRT